MQTVTSQFKEVMLRDSPFWGKCARHQNECATSYVSKLFLCDGCALRLTRGCFNDRPPIYHGELSRGYCGLCNEIKDISLRQWFIDPSCLEVVAGYSKSIAATKLLHDTWQKQINPMLPELQLQEPNAVHIGPLLSDMPSPSSIACSPHFSVTQKRRATDEILFHVELNISHKSPHEIGEFQLAVDECLDIEMVMEESERPTYVFFAQVIEEHSFPTKRNVGQSLWWTDIFTLRDNLIAVRHPRGKTKYTGYFKPDMFKTIDSFIQHLVQQRYFDVRQLLVTQGVPKLPRR